MMINIHQRQRIMNNLEIALQKCLLDKQEKAEALYSQLERELEKLLENNGMSCILRHLCGSDLWVKALNAQVEEDIAMLAEC